MPKIVTKKEYKKRRMRFQIAAGFFDFAVIVAAFFAIAFCIYVLYILYSRVAGDTTTTFSVFFDILSRVLTTN